MTLRSDGDATLAERPMADQTNDTDVLELAGDMVVEEALAVVKAAGVNGVAIRFGAFADGRGFSLAVHLRRAGFNGTLTAVGDVLPDQAAFLKRVGFDAVASDSHAGDKRFDALGDFSAHYQPAPGAQAGQAGQRLQTAYHLRVHAAAHGSQWAPLSV